MERVTIKERWLEERIALKKRLPAIQKLDCIDSMLDMMEEKRAEVSLRNTVAATTSGILIFTGNIENGVSDGATFQWYTVQKSDDMG